MSEQLREPGRNNPRLRVQEEQAPRREQAGRTVSHTPRPRSRWTRGKIAAVSCAVLVAVLVAALVGGFAWLRWLSADDAADIQGTWYLTDTSTPIVITEDHIQLTEDVSYRYHLNPTDKTIQFTFGNLAGKGCYRFSLDREELVLVDGEFSGIETLGRDIGWTARAFWERLRGGSLAPAEQAGKGVTLLSRSPAGA